MDVELLCKLGQDKKSDQLELETRCGRESHIRPMGPSGPLIELGSREVADKMQ